MPNLFGTSQAAMHPGRFFRETALDEPEQFVDKPED
jgi:hypothetical protein